MQMEQSEAEVINMPGLRSRMAAYQQNTTQKKKHGATSQKDKKKRVGKLKDELRDPTQFESAAAAVKPNKPVFTYAEGADALDTSNAAALQSRNQEHEQLEQRRPMSPLRRRNPSAISTNQSPNENRHQSLTPNEYNNMHVSVNSFDSEDGCARAMLGAISGKHGNYEQEMVAKTRLNVLLQREMKDSRVANNYASCRVRYLRAVGNLRPADYYGDDDMNDSFNVEDMGLPSPDVRDRRRQKRKTEKEKKGRYDELKETWHTYDDVALDKPMEPTPEEKELENDLDEIEDEIHEEWEEFTQDVLLGAEEEKEAGVEEEDPDIEEWREEQRKLKEDAVNRKKRKVEREKRRQEFMETKRREQDARRKAESEKKEKPAEPAQLVVAEAVMDKPQEQAETAHDVDAEHEASPQGKGRGKKGKPKKKKQAPKDDKNEKQAQENKKLVEAEHQKSSDALPEADSDPTDEEESSISSFDDGGDNSLAMRTDAAWKKRGKSGALNNHAYFGQEDEEEEEDILANVDTANFDANKDNEKDRKPRRPNREKSVDMIELPPNPNASNNQTAGQSQTPPQPQAVAQLPRKKKELRIEYDNGIPKEITLIINKDPSLDADDNSYSTVSGSESEDSESSYSESSGEIENLLPVKKNGVKKTDSPKKVEDSPTKQKIGVLRIDTLPAQQFYDGTEESPFIAWTHRPLKSKVDGSQIVVKVPPRTDCWRKTRHNFIMDNAPFYWHRVSGNFEVMVKVSGDMKKMYDKAGIMIRLDAENWICTGLEFFNNELNHMTCVTRDYTDWSMAPVAQEAKTQGAWICIKRIGNAYESFSSLDGRNWRQARQGIFSDAKSVRVGIFCACPMGESYRVTFDKYRCKNLL